MKFRNTVLVYFYRGLGACPTPSSHFCLSILWEYQDYRPKFFYLSVLKKQCFGKRQERAFLEVCRTVSLLSTLCDTYLRNHLQVLKASVGAILHNALTTGMVSPFSVFTASSVPVSLQTASFSQAGQVMCPSLLPNAQC